MSNVNRVMVQVGKENLEFEFYRIGPRKLNKILMRVLKLAGKPLAANMDKDVLPDGKELSPEEEEKKTSEMMSNILSILSDSLDEYVVDSVMFDILSECMCKGKGFVKDNFDTIFSGSLIAMWKVTYYAFKYYYSDFFAEGSSLISLGKNMLKQKSVQAETQVSAPQQ